MRAFRFSAPKGPGFGISQAYYLSVLAPGGPMPTPLHLAQPKGQNGAVEGFIAPLHQGASKDALQQPLVRGTYVIASKDQKTVLQMLMMRAEESGVAPDRLAQAAQLSFIPEWIFQFTFRSHDPEVVPAVEFLLELVNRLGLLVNGVVADPICQRYIDPVKVFVQPRSSTQVNVIEHVVIMKRAYASGVAWYTLGLQKFALPEFEIVTTAGVSEAVITPILVEASQNALQGKSFADGLRLVVGGVAVTVKQGGFDAVWNGLPVWELEVNA